MALRYGQIALCIVAVQLIAVAGAHAQITSIGARFSAGVSSVPPAPDIAGMGSANTAVPYSSSGNPANLVYFDKYGEFKPKLGLSVNYINLGFDEGPDTDIMVYEMSGKVGPGYFRLAYARFESDIEDLKSEPVSLEFWGNTLQAAYAQRILDKPRHKLSLGLNLIVNEGNDSTIYAGPFAVGGVAASGAKLPSLQLGAQYEWNNKLFLGLAYDHFESESVTSVLGFGLGKEEETVDIIRPGIAIRPWRGATIGLDWQHIQVRSPSFDLDRDALYFGIEQFVHKNLAFYLGSADGGLTAGVWLNIKERVAISYAYQDKGLRALEPVFGRGRLHTLSVGVTF